MFLRTFATAGRVLRQLSHDPRSIALMLLMPSMLVGLFAWLFSGQEGAFDRFGGPILALAGLVLVRDRHAEEVRVVLQRLDQRRLHVGIRMTCHQCECHCQQEKNIHRLTEKLQLSATMSAPSNETASILAVMRQHMSGT